MITKKHAKIVADKMASLNFKEKIKIADKFDFIPLMNHRCQFNAVHAVKAGIASRVVEVVMVGQGDATAHYINEVEGVGFVDFTLGWAWRNGDYRLVRYVNESEFDNINQSLTDLKMRIYLMMPWWRFLFSPSDLT